MEHLQRMCHAYREHLPFWTPASVPVLGLVYAPIVDTIFPELSVPFLDLSPWIRIGTLSIFHRIKIQQDKYPVVWYLEISVITFFVYDFDIIEVYRIV